MQIFDVTGCRAQIVRPGMDLTAWAAAHALSAGCAEALSVGCADSSPGGRAALSVSAFGAASSPGGGAKYGGGAALSVSAFGAASSPGGGAKYGGRAGLFALCNASLYHLATRVPIGTIIENGKMAHDDGNGYGFGTVDGSPGFGMPWDRPWDDYLTGYNAPVQNGVYVAPAFADGYVFGCRLARIGVGQQGRRTVIVTDDCVTLRQFAENAVAQGVTTLVNLDGGGSRHLWYDGRAVYSSPRVPYNAIAFYRETPIPQSPDGDSSLSQREPGCEYCTEDGRCGKRRA